jgi:hypothetical protein
MPKPKKNLSFSCDLALYNKARRLARASHTSVSSVIRRLIARAYEKTARA